MIKYIKIENFKIFKLIEFDLRKFSVLMGENGSGKTSILQAIALGLRIFNSTDLIKYDKTRKIIRLRPKGVPYPQLPGFHLEDIYEIFYSKQARGGAVTLQTELEFSSKFLSLKIRLKKEENHGKAKTIYT